MCENCFEILIKILHIMGKDDIEIFEFISNIDLHTDGECVIIFEQPQLEQYEQLKLD